MPFERADVRPQLTSSCRIVPPFEQRRAAARPVRARLRWHHTVRPFARELRGPCAELCTGRREGRARRRSITGPTLRTRPCVQFRRSHPAVAALTHCAPIQSAQRLTHISEPALETRRAPVSLSVSRTARPLAVSCGRRAPHTLSSVRSAADARSCGSSAAAAARRRHGQRPRLFHRTVCTSSASNTASVTVPPSQEAALPPLRRWMAAILSPAGKRSPVSVTRVGVPCWCPVSVTRVGVRCQ